MFFKLRHTLLAVLCLTALTGLARAQQKVIRWATNPQYPPYGWAASDSEYAGAGTELLPLIAPKGYVWQPVMVPWARAQEMAKRGEIDLLLNLRITPERSKWLKFSSHPTFFNPIVVFMREDHAIPFKSWHELKPLRGGVTLGDAFGNGFDEFLKDHLATEAIPNMSGNFRKLDSGRIDYFVSGYYMGLAWLSNAGLQGRIGALTPPVSATSIHLGFSQLSPHRGLLPEIDRKLAILGADGTLARLLAESLKKYSDTPQAVFAE